MYSPSVVPFAATTGKQFSGTQDAVDGYSMEPIISRVSP